MAERVQEVNDINAVLRDLLLERGISEDSVEQLVDLVDRVAWCESAKTKPGDALDSVIHELNVDLNAVSRRHSPVSVRPRPTMAEANSAFRESWNEALPPFQLVFSKQQAASPYLVQDRASGELTLQRYAREVRMQQVEELARAGFLGNARTMNDILLEGAPRSESDEARVARGRCPVEGCNQPHDHVDSHHWSSDYGQ